MHAVSVQGDDFSVSLGLCGCVSVCDLFVSFFFSVFLSVVFVLNPCKRNTSNNKYCFCHKQILSITTGNATLASVSVLRAVGVLLMYLFITLIFPRHWGFYTASDVWAFYLPLLVFFFFFTSPSPVAVIIQSNSTSTVQFPLPVSLIKHFLHHAPPPPPFPPMHMQYTDTNCMFIVRDKKVIVLWIHRRKYS